ncbi:MAG TPA: serine/threonine-protein kinase, partial [Polyangia bacterium]|nr:serine/threonine-protein kinase [Polyangia bacterium]
LFAAGIILWELLTGRQVYPAKTPRAAEGEGEPAGRGASNDAEELLRRVRRPVILPPSQRASRVTPELDRVALQALAPKLADRYVDCAALARDLTAYLQAKHPATNAKRVAQFMTELYGEDMEADRLEREAVFAEARALSAQPRTAADDQPVGSMTLPVVPRIVPLPPKPPLQTSQTSASDAQSSVDSPLRRSERGTVVGGPAGRAMRHRDEVSAAFAETQSSSSNPGMNSTTVIGSLIGGRYRVKRLSGEGGMGRVYEAEHIEIGKRVALKILHPGYSQTPDLVERLRREARAASRIGHPNVVDVTDSGTTDDGSFFFVMEYLEGRELGEIVFQEKGLDVRRSIIIAAQICRALRAAHDAGVIHRDLKPENVLLVARDGQKDFVKVLDFGIAKNITDSDDLARSGLRRKLTNPGVAMGTPEYMAPEQAAGHPADARSDIYAVGGILYEMLCGHPAYEGANFMEVLHKKANFAPEPINKVRHDVPAELEALILSAMAKDPAARPQTMSDLEASLQDILTRVLPHELTPAPGVPHGDTPRPVVLVGGQGRGLRGRLFGDRRKSLAAGAVAVMAVVLTVAALGVGRTRANGARAAGQPVPVVAPPA